MILRVDPGNAGLLLIMKRAPVRVKPSVYIPALSQAFHHIFI
jgi:hypothetical protein